MSSTSPRRLIGVCRSIFSSSSGVRIDCRAEVFVAPGPTLFYVVSNKSTKVYKRTNIFIKWFVILLYICGFVSLFFYFIGINCNFA